MALHRTSQGIAVDIVTIHHNEKNLQQSLELHKTLLEVEEDFTFNLVDNSVENRGFAKASNIGASWGDHSVIGFLNPDVEVRGPFVRIVEGVFASDPDVVITGSNHNKPESHIKAWGLWDWVCGCTMFVRRDWWDEVGGFDERFIWSFEDTDLCRQAEQQGKVVRSIELPLHHESPTDDSLRDKKYKQHNTDLAGALYYRKWRNIRKPVRA